MPVPTMTTPRDSPWPLRIMTLLACLALATASLLVYFSPIAEQGNRLATFAAEGWLLISLTNALLVLPLLAWTPHGRSQRMVRQRLALLGGLVAGPAAIIFMAYLVADSTWFLVFWPYFMPLTGLVWVALVLARTDAKPEARLQRLLLGSGFLVSLLYLPLVLLYIRPADGFFFEDWLIVTLVLLGLGMGFAGGSLLVYRATHPAWRRWSVPLRSLGSSASLVTLLGALCILGAMIDSGARLDQLLIPLYALQMGIAFALLWLQTFPVTSPSARNIMRRLLYGGALLNTIVLVWAAQGEPFGYWFAAMSAAWLAVLGARPLVAPHPLDLDAAPAPAGPDLSPNHARPLLR